MAQAATLPVEVAASHNRGVTIDVQPSDNNDVPSLVRQAAIRQNVDPDLASNIAHQESRFNPNAVSPKGAKGVMQLMPDTAKGLGVNPNNLHENIDGGVAYIKQLQDKYGADRPDLIAAGYNAGPNAVDKHGGVPPYPETQSYVKNVTSNLGPSLEQLQSSVNGSPAANSAPTNAEPSLEQLQSSVAPQSQPAAKPQSPGYQAAYKTFVNSSPPDPNNAFHSLTDSIASGAMSNTLPMLMGTSAALGTGLNNFLYKNFGIGSAPQSNMSEAFNGTRQAASDQLATSNTVHPILTAVGNTAGFLGSPALKVLGAGRAALAAKAGLTGLGSRVALGGLEAGTAGAAAGAGQGASEGGTPSQIGQQAAISGGLSALGGSAGEALAPVLGKGATALVGKEAHPAAHVAARVGAHALGSGLVGGGLGYVGSGGNMKAAVTMGSIAAGFGSTGGIKESPSIAPGAYLPEHADIATEHLAKTVAPNLNEAAEHFAASPHSTTAEAAGEHAPKLLETATQANSNSVGTLKNNIAERQNQTNVKTKLINDVNKAVGGDITEASNNTNNEISNERQENRNEANSANLINKITTDINNITGIHPAEAEMNVSDYLENKRNTINADKWKKVDNETPVITKEHDKLLAEEPVVRTALNQAQRDLGPEGSTANPNFKPNGVELKTPDNISNEDIAEVLKDKHGSDIRGENVPLPGLNQETADYLNAKRGINENDEPETVPTQKAWIKAERYLGRSVPRNAFGKVDYSNPRTIEIQNSQRDVNAANKQHFEGLSEAKAASGEDFSFERAKELGNNLNTTKTSESPEAFAKRYETLSDPEKEATQHGYLEEFYRKLRNNPIATVNEYSNDIHQKFQKTMFGQAEASKIQDSLNTAKTVKQYAEKGGIIEQANNKVAAILKTNDSVKISEAYDKATPEEKDAFENQYKAKLAQAINNVNASGNNIEEKHLNDLNKFTTDETERATQDKIFGKEKANQLRSAITQQIESAKSGNPISKFSSTSKTAAEKDHDTVQAAALGFVSHGLHGALKGVGVTSALKSTGHVLEAVKQGRMTPEVQQALADKLAQSPQQTAQNIRDLKSKKQNMPRSKSTVVQDLVKHAFKGIGYTVGHRAANAFTGVNN